MALSKKKILVVEDDRDIMNFVVDFLTERGYDVLKAFNGLDGLKAARTQNPDLILLDVMLPKINGLAVCRLLKYDEKYKQIPIIIWSWKEDDSDREIGLDSGADAYVPKPFSIPRLGETIARLLG